MRELLFDYIGLEPTGKLTGTGAHSTDAESLQTLAEEHEVPQLILNVRQNVKIKTTYIDKILPALEPLPVLVGLVGIAVLLSAG